MARSAPRFPWLALFAALALLVILSGTAHSQTSSGGLAAGLPACCDPAAEPGVDGNPFCFEGHACCADGNWSCNFANGSTTCEAPGEVCEVDLCAGFTPPGCVQSGCDEGEVCDTTVGCNPSACACDPDTGQVVCTTDCDGGTCVPAPPPICCDPANQPGTGGNPFCIEGASCCADGDWSCNAANGSSTCERPSEACTGCCDPAQEPGVDGNPLCFEGHSCCADGIWRCNAGDASPTCEVLGIVCEEDPCAGFSPPGCVQSGCPDGHTCDTNVGCVPSHCECNPDTGAIVCTDDCGGGTCVPEPAAALLSACALATLALLRRRSALSQ